MALDNTLYATSIVVLLIAIYKWITLNDQYFAKRNLPHLKPTFLLGNTFGQYLKKYSLDIFESTIYNKFPTAKIIGYFDMREPVYFLRDVEVIKQIAIKDFDYFEDRVFFFEDTTDKLIGLSIFLLKGNKWREMRSTLSPAFTGSKMRQMFGLVCEVAEETTAFFTKESKSNKIIRWEMKELFSRFTNDIIASCAFGLKVNSFEDRTNEFFSVGQKNLNLATTRSAVRIALLQTIPTIMRLLGIEFISRSGRKFFTSMVFDTMKVREEKNIVRPDMINILMQIRKGTLNNENHEDSKQSKDDGIATEDKLKAGKAEAKREWTNDELVAQCFLFFAAGFDTTSTCLKFVAYELAVNQNVQQRLYNEVCEINATLNGSRLSYDILQKLKYMDQVISETLRKWPSTIFLTRKCTKDYVCKLDGQQKFVIEKGKVIYIPIAAIQRDPKFFADPEKFDPERFSDENKHKIKSGTFFPFGSGPRMCIGSRFAMMEMKAVLFHLLLNFIIQPYEKTQIPVKISKNVAKWSTEDGVHLEFKPRQ